eukprot:TRINITY_DN21684_c0_g1_i2.p1 TRINITY_DN21684_c0_g1~~TRINITY_DN21684_c0_g1_i2.p1  ORF type:complete len:264 (-),score=47.98 TRINITY_DN21684_c0_g1_i2:321-1112(-)
MASHASRDGRRQSRLLRGNEHGFEVCTVDHRSGGTIRVDATISYAEDCYLADEGSEELEAGRKCEIMTFAHAHEDFDHDLWFSAYVPQENDGRYLGTPNGTLNPEGSGRDFSNPDEVYWWHMKDGAVLGLQKGMIMEYDSSTLAPLGLVVSRDELLDRRIAVIDDGSGGSVLLLFADSSHAATVVQPNDDGSYWRRVVRNKLLRTRERRRLSVAKEWVKAAKADGEPVKVLASYGPYKTAAGMVIELSTKPVDPKRKDDAIKK